MQRIDRLEDIEKPYQNAVVTIGNFDGVHIGHQALLHDVVERAATIGGTAVVITFDPHPLQVLTENGHPPQITLLEQKSDLIAATGVDILVVIPFTREFAAISARDFVADLLIKRIGMHTIVIGRDYRFGRNREGDLDLLRTYGETMGFDVRVIDWIQGPRNGIPRISSTAIRNLVMEGELERARKMLGRPYQILGDVAHGRNRGGRLLGFPTANIRLLDELCPKTGIYAVTVECRDGRFMGVANIGYSPTFDDHLFTVEVHILDYHGDLYGEKIRVNFIERLRSEIRFDSLAALSDQIRADIVAARRILSH